MQKRKRVARRDRGPRRRPSSGVRNGAIIKPRRSASKCRRSTERIKPRQRAGRQLGQPVCPKIKRKMPTVAAIEEGRGDVRGRRKVTVRKDRNHQSVAAVARGYTSQVLQCGSQRESRESDAYDWPAATDASRPLMDDLKTIRRMP